MGGGADMRGANERGNMRGMIKITCLLSIDSSFSKLNLLHPSLSLEKSKSSKSSANLILELDARPY